MTVLETRQTKKKRKRSTKHDERAFHEMLAGRLTVPGSDTPWPEWTKLGESFLKGSHTCACSNESHDNGKSQYTKCASCQNNPMLHRLQVVVRVSNESSSLWQLQLFCTIRNLRCIGGLIAMEKCSLHQLQTAAASEAHMLHQIMRQSTMSLPAGEAELLNQKCQTVLTTVDSLLSFAKKKNTKSSSNVESVSFFFPEA